MSSNQQRRDLIIFAALSCAKNTAEKRAVTWQSKACPTPIQVGFGMDDRESAIDESSSVKAMRSGEGMGLTCLLQFCARQEIA
jgi:hypothetical protein